MASKPPADPPDNSSTNTNTSPPSPHQGTLRPPKHTTIVATAVNPNALYVFKFKAGLHLRTSRKELRTAIKNDPYMQHRSVSTDTWWRVAALDTDKYGTLVGPGEWAARANQDYLTIEEMEMRKEAMTRPKSGLGKEVDLEGWHGKDRGIGDGKGGNMKRELVWWSRGS